MFYQPNFCCECGEKIERSDWKLWTSRRFCPLCATDHQLRELAPKAAAGAGILITLFAAGSFLQGRGPTSPQPESRTFASSAASRQPETVNKQATDAGPVQSQSRSPQPFAVNQNPNAALTTSGSVPAAKPAAPTESPVYFCGAATKKGTPCSRRVKTKDRCWQHAGQPAMLPPEKLRISG